nr:retrovirus-related Pol polyprotein from transposon TNT 1-94 [Tanacetum cinerariifolium]
PSIPTYVHAEENNDNQAEEEHLPDDEFTNPFCALAQEVAESSSHHIGNSNVPTLNLPQVSKYRWTKDHPLEQVRRNPSRPVQTRRQLATYPKMCMFALTVSTDEPKNIKEAIVDSAWIEAMQEELHQFDRLQVWELVDKPFGKTIIRLKWLWKKKDEDQTIICSKERLVTKGYAQEEDGHETAFLNGPVKEEVYVAQPDEFVDPDHPEKVYRLRKALYGLKQALKAWYDEISKFLTSKGFTKGTIDPTIFTIRYGEDILLMQIYVDDIIFGSTNPKYTKRFEKLMHSRFDMSLMGEMKLFLGLQIHQSPHGIFINQAKYTLEILHKHGMEKGHSIGTPMATKPKLDADLSRNPVDETDYHSKIGSLMYLTSSRPDIVQAACFCARYQSRPTEKHLKEVKRIFRYLRGTINMGLWYPKGSSFGLTAFSDADHAGCIDTHKSTSRGIQFLCDKLVRWMSKKQDCTAMSSVEAEYVALSASCAQVITEYQLADIFTKALPEDRFKYLIRRIEYGCAWYGSAVRGCMRLLWQTKSRGTTIFCCSGGHNLEIVFSSTLLEHSLQITPGLDDDVAASFQRSRIHHHMLMLKIQRHTKHQESSNIKKKTFANSDKQDLPSKNQVYQGRLLASFQDDAKYEHVGQETRSQGGKDDQD